LLIIRFHNLIKILPFLLHPASRLGGNFSLIEDFSGGSGARSSVCGGAVKQEEAGEGPVYGAGPIGDED
jgi:hypothetical protein